ncbi:MAG: hypothetical protein PHH04_06985 [Thomasclavelia sp.]|nr:hypothetical protein [Thomasclavelia sp.]
MLSYIEKEIEIARNSKKVEKYIYEKQRKINDKMKPIAKSWKDIELFRRVNFITKVFSIILIILYLVLLAGLLLLSRGIGLYIIVGDFIFIIAIQLFFDLYLASKWKCPCCQEKLPTNYHFINRPAWSVGMLTILNDKGISYVKSTFSEVALPASCPHCGYKFYPNQKEEKG